MGRVPRATFTFSDAAKTYIRSAISDGDRRSPDDPIVATSIGWGTYHGEDGRSGDGLVVGFYNRSNLHAIADALQSVSDMPVFFWVRPDDVGRFEGKTIDYDQDRWLYLR